MDKRYQVFISSTYVDLKEERQEVIQALLELDCIPAGMELFPAADEDQWSLIKKVIDDCDYYLVIIGGRYGSMSSDGISYTQKEFEYAVAAGKPVIGFIHKDPGSIAASKTEHSEEGKQKLEGFRKQVQERMCKHWESPAELGSVVSRSLIKLIKNKPATGWVRADLVPDESSSQEILALKKQIEALRMELEQSRHEAPKEATELAQGNDRFEIHFSYETTDPLLNDFFSENTQYSSSVIATWEEMFYQLSPLMVDEATEWDLIQGLNEFIIVKKLDAIRTLHAKQSIKNLTVNNPDFQTIKIQFRALGLIRKNEKQRSVKDLATYWSLTPYGDSIMTRLRAIRRVHPPSTVDDSTDLPLDQ